MKKSSIKALFLAVLAVLYVSCTSGNKEPEVNPLWGMWLQEYPSVATKSEIMFNDDSTGFVFNVDTLVYETRWSGDDVIKVQYNSYNGGELHGLEKSYKVSVVQDTLTLLDETDGTEKRYIRVAE